MPKKLDSKEFEIFFKENFRSLTFHAYKYLKDVDLAKDIVHNAFTKLWEKRDEIDSDKNIKSYLFTTVTNLALNYIRDHKKIVNIDEEKSLKNVSENSVDEVENTEIGDAIVKAINKLPDKTKEVFMLSRYENLKNAEVAEKLGISIKTVEAHISKALKELRLSLKQYKK